MSKEQNTKIEQKSKKNDVEVLDNDVKKKESSMNFDLYFQKMMSKNSNVLPHHKAAMKKYAEQKGLIEADEREFDEIFRIY